MLRVGPPSPLCVSLPFPPTVNTYWRRVGNRTVLSAGARAYRGAVHGAVLEHLFGVPRREPLTGPVAVEIEFRPPDRRRRDLDNLPKGLLDALKHAGIYEDDSQVRRLNTWFGPVQDGGLSVVTVTAIT
jgi:crossover junction endodeoxyribonuclease RusA